MVSAQGSICQASPKHCPEGLIITLLHCFKNDVPVDSKQKVTIEDVP